jgi:hypothetical protein
MLSNQVFEWNLVTGRINEKHPMPYKSVDFGSTYLNNYIYIVGGWITELFHSQN